MGNEVLHCTASQNAYIAVNTRAKIKMYNIDVHYSTWFIYIFTSNGQASFKLQEFMADLINLHNSIRKTIESKTSIGTQAGQQMY